ncbi:MAG TPA: pyridoxal phosphate-dependent aminotransferase [Gammaproteobacteria bacterium]|nr:pyridoxal phosphate-dependent aminotransferase [Gammaproteobacteria bacterium]
MVDLHSKHMECPVLSDRVKRLQPSPTLAVTARAAELRAEGRDIIALGAGEPDFDTPEFIKQAAVKALENGETKYTAVDGTPRLKKAIIEKFKRDNGLDYQADQILVSCGGKQSFFNLFQSVINPDDEVVMMAPYWVSYPAMVEIAGGKPVVISADAASRYKITPEQLDKAITPKTKVVVLNSPSNPTGVAYSRAELEALGAVLRKHSHVLIATDDMYEHILWADEPFSNIVMACPDLYDRTLVMNGVSKAYAMTGWRIGYTAGPADIIKAMKKVQSQSTSNPAAVSQAGAAAALEGDQGCVAKMREAFRERHSFVLDALNQLPGVKAVPADGTFYSFPAIGEAISKLGLKDDIAFCEHLLNEAGVAVVPGTAFGSPGHFRLSFATSMDHLQQAMQRLKEVLK